MLLHGVSLLVLAIDASSARISAQQQQHQMLAFTMMTISSSPPSKTNLFRAIGDGWSSLKDGVYDLSDSITQSSR